MKQRALLTAVLFLLYAPSLLSQWIDIRTVPIIASNQSQFYPSLARGMGNLSVAFDDPFADPFVNPAKAERLSTLTLFASPTRNSWSNEDGGPVSTAVGSSAYPGAAFSSFPFGGFIRKESLFGGALFAYQGYNAERSRQSGVVPFGLRDALAESPPSRHDIGNNTYLFGLFGVRFPESQVSVAASAAWAKYGAIDGVNLLYPGSNDIRQDGWTLEYKLGVVGELTERDRLEFIAGWARFKATHDVTYSTASMIGPPVNSPYRTEINKDETSQWLLHAGYRRSMSDAWKVGATIAVNWKDHPKIPNYDLANIPRDPGTSVAYNFGLGALWSNGKSSWGFEYVYEPITSNTWAEAGEDPARVPPLPPTFKTVENFFDFSNHIFRIGHQSDTNVDWLNYRFGAQFHVYSYSLDQHNNIAGTSRSMETGWVETTLSGGLTARFSNIQLIYTLQLVLGNGLVGTAGGMTRADAGALTNDFLVAPSGRLVVDDIALVTQQLSFVFFVE